jgi:uncharacterized protein (DUF2267 family)
VTLRLTAIARSLAAAACTRVVQHHIPEGEIEDVFARLPSDIRAVLEPAAA